jgi:3-hydroxyacyl-[acyl-carrier-protein] dehydratase
LEHKVRFRREILPGETLELHCEVLSWKRGICKGKGVATVKGEIACEAEMMITIPEILEQYLPKKAN